MAWIEHQNSSPGENRPKQCPKAGQLDYCIDSIKTRAWKDKMRT